MELKYGKEQGDAHFQKSINRTFMELKLELNKGIA